MNRLARLLNSSTDGQDLASLALQERLLRGRCQALRTLLRAYPGGRQNSYGVARLTALEAELKALQDRLLTDQNKDYGPPRLPQ